MSDNLNEVEAALKNHLNRFDIQIGRAAEEISLQLEGDGKREIKGQRPKGEKATKGQPPMNRTGNLRRSIRGESMRKGFGKYTAIVGADIEYARAVEIGAPYNPPSWQNGEYFPYLSPALNKFASSGKIQRIITKHLRSI
jgi:phage gpG-like protein